MASCARGLAVLSLLLAFAPAALAQSCPARQVRVIVPFAPGAASDITGRLVAQKLAEGFSQSFIVDNRPGAGGNIGHELAARAAAKVELTHVPCKGAAPALADVLGGQIEMIATTILSSQALIQAGKLRALAVTSSKRSSTLPAVPTVAETLPGFDAVSWLLLLGPAKMPVPVVSRLQQETARFLEQPEMRKRIAADGGEPVGSTPAEAAAFLKAELARWGEVIRHAGVQPEG